jgi:cold shock CspA family protein
MGKVKEALSDTETWQKKQSKIKGYITGQVLWWDERDGNGIIVSGNSRTEWYFDISVLKPRESVVKRGDWVTFQPNAAIKDTRCACNVIVQEQINATK